jgi:hypothetical protein
VELLRELVPGGTADEAGIERTLSDAGYRLQLVDSDISRLRAPLVVWLLRTEEVVHAEVYGQSLLYADGPDDQRAIENLVELMHLWHTELAQDASGLAGPARELHAFLDRLLEPLS